MYIIYICVRRARLYQIKEKKKNVSVTIAISFLHSAGQNVKNGARVVTMCNAMQRNENHFGRVTFPPGVRVATTTSAARASSPGRLPPARYGVGTTLWNPSRHTVRAASGTRRLHRSVGVLKPVGQPSVGRAVGARGIRHSSSGSYWSEPSPRSPVHRRAIPSRISEL